MSQSEQKKTLFLISLTCMTVKIIKYDRKHQKLQRSNSVMADFGSAVRCSGGRLVNDMYFYCEYHVLTT